MEMTEAQCFMFSVFKNKGAGEKKLTATKGATVGIQAHIGDSNTI
jgi:hypothetical protein